MDISLLFTKKSIVNFLHRYHIIIFFLIVVTGLGVAVLTLSGIINKASESDGYVSTGSNVKFDQATIDRVNQLKSRDQNQGTIDFSNGRTNPFVE